MHSADKPESKELSPEQKEKRDQIRGVLSRSSDPNTRPGSEEDHFRALMLKAMPKRGMSPEEEEELHFRNLMGRKKT